MCLTKIHSHIFPFLVESLIQKCSALDKPISHLTITSPMLLCSISNTKCNAKQHRTISRGARVVYEVIVQLFCFVHNKMNKRTNLSNGFSFLGVCHEKNSISSNNTGVNGTTSHASIHNSQITDEKDKIRTSKDTTTDVKAISGVHRWHHFTNKQNTSNAI